MERKYRGIRGIAVAVMLVVFFNSLGLVPAGAAEAIQVKIGTLRQNEIWKGRIYIVGDVTIPLSHIVTVEAGSVLTFSDTDILHTGEDKNKSEILAYGTLDLLGTADRPIQMTSMDNGSFKEIAVDPHTRILRFSPYEAETATLRDEFRRFKIQYVVLWTLVYAMIILRR